MAEPSDHPHVEREAKASTSRLPPHPALAEWYGFTERQLVKQKEVVLGTPYVAPATRRLQSRYNMGSEAEHLRHSRERPHGFREISSLKDEEAVKRLFKSGLLLQPKMLSEVSRDVRLTLSASSYARHLAEGADTSLARLEAKIKDLDDPELSSLVTKTKEFAGQSAVALDDVMGFASAADVNLCLANRDRFISKLRPYLNHGHRSSLRYGNFSTDSLFPNLAEVRTAARDDAAHESTRQLATHSLGKSDRTTSRPAERGVAYRGQKSNRSSTGNNDRQGSTPFPRRPASGGNYRRGGPLRCPPGQPETWQESRQRVLQVTR